MVYLLGYISFHLQISRFTCESHVLLGTLTFCLDSHFLSCNSHFLLVPKHLLFYLHKNNSSYVQRQAWEGNEIRPKCQLRNPLRQLNRPKSRNTAEASNVAASTDHRAATREPVVRLTAFLIATKTFRIVMWTPCNFKLFKFNWLL